MGLRPWRRAELRSKGGGVVFQSTLCTRLAQRISPALAGDFSLQRGGVVPPRDQIARLLGGLTPWRGLVGHTQHQVFSRYRGGAHWWRCLAPPNNDGSRCIPNSEIAGKISRFCHGLGEPIR